MHLQFLQTCARRRARAWSRLRPAIAASGQTRARPVLRNGPVAPPDPPIARQTPVASGFSQSTCTACEMQPGSFRERCTCSRLNLRTSFKEFCRAVTLPVTTIILSSPCLNCCVVMERPRRRPKVERLLRPALQRGVSGVGQYVDAAFGAIEPAIDIVQQDLRRVGNFGPQIAHPSRALRQRRRAGQRLLAIGRHDRGARAAAQRRVALAPLVLGDQPRALLRIAARARGRRLDQHLDVSVAGDAEHAETEPAAEIAIARVALAALAARRHPGREPDLVAGAGAVDRLQHQFEIEGQFQLADHHDAADRRRSAPPGRSRRPRP